MDGYPSDSAQAAIFLQLIGMPTSIIYLDIPESVMSQRLKDRYNFDDEVHSIMNRIEKFKKNMCSTHIINNVMIVLLIY